MDAIFWISHHNNSLSPATMKFLVSSDDTGGIKEVICSRGTDSSKKDGQQAKSITNFFDGPEVSSKSKIIKMDTYKSQYLIASRLDGRVCIYDLTKDPLPEEEEEKYQLLHQYSLPITSDEKPISLLIIEQKDVIIVAYNSGRVFFIHLNNGAFDLEPISFQLKRKEVDAFVSSPYNCGVFAYGGKENDLKVIRLFNNLPLKAFKSSETSKYIKEEILYAAKNVKNDHLDLRVPIWISNIRFFETESKDHFKLITSTRYGQVRIYDSTHGKKPLADYKVSEKPILTMNFSNSEQDEIIISDTHNLIAKFTLSQIDEKALKTNSASAGEIVKPVPKLLGKFSSGGNTGATFGVEFSDFDIVAFGGLDRYLRVFDAQSREILVKVYLGVEISDIVILDAEDEEEEEEVNIESGKLNIQKKRRRDILELEDEDKEDLWQTLEDNRNDKKKKI